MSPAGPEHGLALPLSDDDNNTPNISRRSSFRRKTSLRLTRSRSRGQAKAQHRRQSQYDHIMPEVVPLAEYEALPPSIQRKYFSATERLRFAQESASLSRRKSRRKGTWLSVSSTIDSHHSRKDSVVDDTSRSSSISTLKPDQQIITLDDALWFLSLPEKIRRRQFDHHEQVLLTKRCEETVDRLSPEPLLTGTPRNLSFDQRETLAVKPPQSQPDVDFDTETSVFIDTDSVSPQKAEVSGDDMQFLKLYTRRRVSINTDASLSTPTLNEITPPISPAEPKTLRSAKPPLTRARTLRPINLPPPRLAPPPKPKAPASRRNSAPYPNFSRPRHSCGLPPHPSVYTNSYEDNEQRGKKHDFVVSPYTFDEAIDLGCPSSPEPTKATEFVAELPGDLPVGYSFFSMDNEDVIAAPQNSPSYSDINNEDDRVPSRLSTVDEYHHSLAECGSMDSGIGMSMPQRKNSIAAKYSHNPIIEDRQTVRTTLTRPSEEDISLQDGKKSPIQSDDPLALDTLLVTEDTTGTKGAFAIPTNSQSKGIKRVWKSIRRQ